MTLIKFKNHFPTLLDEFFSGDIFNPTGRVSTIENSIPAVNVKDQENHFEVQVAVPGMKKDDFKVEIQNGVLGISSESKEENEEEKKNYTRKEFSYHSFKRTFTLPDIVDENDISANYEDGVLKITIPKRAEEKKDSSRVISIN